MIIKVRSFAMIREIIGDKSIEFKVSDPNIWAVISELVQKYPQLQDLLITNNKLHSTIVVAVNGERVEHDKIYTEQLEENDELAILPPAGGG